VTAATPGQAAHAAYLGDDTSNLVAGESVADRIWASMSNHGNARWEAAAQAGHDHIAAREPHAAPDPRVHPLDAAVIHRELHELSDNHDELLEELMRNTGDEWDGDEAAEAIAVKYVRHLESLVPPAQRVPEGRRTGDAKPAPELAAAVKAAVITGIREAANCDSDDGDQCQRCSRYADAILAAIGRAGLPS
jgi:hypothetical protein